MPDSRSASEKAIEDVFAKHPDITEETLNYPDNSLTLLARQQTVDIGRTDLLFLAGEELLLIELKAERATEDNVVQLEEYRDYYQHSVLGDRYPSATHLKPILLAPEIPPPIKQQCRQTGLKPVEFDVGTVLEKFEDRLFTSHSMFEKQPVSTGVASLYLINGLIRYLAATSEPKTKNDCIDDLEKIAVKPDWNKPSARMGQFIRLGIRLNLIQRVNKPPLQQVDQLRVSQSDKLLLTERGHTYAGAMSAGPERVPPLSVDQAAVLTELLYDRPFYSDVTVGMVLFLDSVYDLSRSSDRVSGDALEEWFPKKAGRDWRGRSPGSLVNWYGNYLDEIGLVSKISATDGNEEFHYLTPEGAQLLSYLQVDIGKEMIRAQSR
ncbi:hypothetical protein [Haloarcula sp. 1CSR25-25]|uniref:hypothetical protein n=1 Tax=Haloarcula sp. 1CSR25-25 TaxID=2862545 RepID=UPI002895BFFD|nr:hypothetical protein [Haloarcula sp. 1CSR25-25]MDT3434665.1 hypothetical protein [Haloarcula sp. 1CSR25-25]